MPEETGCIVEEQGEARLKWLIDMVLGGNVLSETQRLAQDIQSTPPTVIVRLQNGRAALEQAVQGVNVEVRDYDVGGMSTVDALNFGCVVDDEGNLYRPVRWNEKGDLVG